MLPPLLNITVTCLMLDSFKLIPMSDVLMTNWEDISVGSQDLANRNQDNTSCALPLNQHPARRNTAKRWHVWCQTDTARLSGMAI